MRRAAQQTALPDDRRAAGRFSGALAGPPQLPANGGRDPVQLEDTRQTSGASSSCPSPESRRLRARGWRCFPSTHARVCRHAKAHAGRHTCAHLNPSIPQPTGRTCLEKKRVPGVMEKAGPGAALTAAQDGVTTQGRPAQAEVQLGSGARNIYTPPVPITPWRDSSLPSFQNNFLPLRTSPHLSHHLGRLLLEASPGWNPLPQELAEPFTGPQVH